MADWRVSDHLPEEVHYYVCRRTHDGVDAVAIKHFTAYYTMDDGRITHAANYASDWIAAQEAINSDQPSPLASRGVQNPFPLLWEQNEPPSAIWINPAAKIMRFRSRLAELTRVQFGMLPEQAWGGEIRTTALQLQKALQSSAEYIFAQCPLNLGWTSDSAPKAIAWKSSCWFSRLPDQTSAEKPLPVGFQMYNRDGKWSISSYHLEAVLGLWLWSLKRSELLHGPAAEEHLIRSKMIVVEKSKRDDMEAALYLWVTQTRQAREYRDVDDITRPDNLSIPTSSLLSRGQSSKQSFGASRQEDTTNREEFTILGIPTSGSTSLLQLMAQDVYTVFINRIANIVGDLRGTGDPEDYLTLRDHSLSTVSRGTPSFELTNPHIDALANSLVSAGVATREEALMSIVPAFLHQMKLPLLDDDMVQSLLDWAKSLRRDLKFREGAALMTWMLSRCPARFHRQGLRCLGDLYRRAALSKKRRDQDFGLSGMRDMKKRHSVLVSDHQAQDILNCYEHLYDFFHGRNTPTQQYWGSGAHKKIDSELRHLRRSGDQGTKAAIGQEDLENALTLNVRFHLSSEGGELLREILRWAIGRDFPELIEDLWMSAILPREEDGISPLNTALDLECELETFHSLLDWPGTDVERTFSHSDTGDYRRTPLLCAIEANRADVVCSILRRGVYLHQATGLGMTTLQCAFRKSNEGMIRLLLGKGAVIDKQDRRIALHLAAEENSEAVIRWMLEEGAKIHEKDGNGRTALHVAAKRNEEAVVRLLLKNGAEIQEKDDVGRTALHFAAETNSEAVIRLLLEKGAEIHEKDNWGCTPLHLAAMSCDQEGVLRLLLEKGAKIHEKDNKGCTPLHLAAGADNEVLVPLLLEKGADMHEKDRHGQTALHIAAQEGHRSVLRLLLEESADNDAENGAENGLVTGRDLSSLWHVIQKDDEEMKELLEEKGIEKPKNLSREEEKEEEEEEEGEY